MINDADMVAALTADYLNVYVIEPESDRARIVKLLGYVIDGIESEPEIFQYSKMLRKYAQDRVCDEDREEFIEEVISEGLLRNFADGRERLEINYRVPINNRLEHFGGLYTRISRPGEHLKLVAGFRNTESIISLQKKTRKEGLYSAYSAISDVYLSMHRVNLKENTFRTIKTTGAILQYSIPGSNRWDENVGSIIKGLAREDSYLSAKEFLDLTTLEERMKGKNHISINFAGKIAGSCILHFIKEDEDRDGRLLHVIFAVEVLGDDAYQSAFNVLARNFKNVYLLNLERGTAKILKFIDEYGGGRLDDVMGQSFPYENILGDWIENSVHPEDRQALRHDLSVQNLRRIFETQTDHSGNYRMLVNGRCVHYQYTLSRLNDHGDVIAGFQNIEDIIQKHKEQERREREKEEAYQREIRIHNEVILSLSTIYSTILRAELDTHEYEIFNSVEQMWSIAGKKGNFDQVKETIIETFIAPEMQERMRSFLDIDTLAERLEHTKTISTDYKDPLGRWFEARFIVKNRTLSGKVNAALYVARDITEEKERELQQQKKLAAALKAAQQANKAKSTFLNSMSHDIRTPMNAIIGFTALAQNHLDEPDLIRDYLAKISTSGAHLLSLINDVLDMSRIESGTVELEEKPLHIPDLLDEMSSMVLGLVHAKNQKLSLHMQDVVHEDVIADKLRLNQVLINLVGNAVKYTPPGGKIAICLTEKTCGTGKSSIYEFCVQDNGMGMSKEFQEHIFDTFSREYSATVSGIQGTGLGMAITRNIVVDMMGGRIEVESEEGRGSKFTVTLCMRLADEADRRRHEDGDPAGSGDNVGCDYRERRILLAEDNELNREIAQALLEEIGVTVDSVCDGDEAVAAIHDAPADRYDLIFMDIQMPRMDGYTATREIRTLADNKKANIPIVAMTANAFEEDREKSLRSGMDGHIVKPINIEMIKKVLDEILENKS